MFKRMVLMLLGVGVVFGAVFGWKAFVAHERDKFMAQMKPPPAAVATATAAAEQWTPTLDAVATLAAVQGVDVTSEVGGLVDSIKFESGDEVQSGDLLVHLDTSADQAELRGLQAKAELARIDYNRNKKLIKSRNISRADLDKSRSTLDNALAQVDKQKALIAKKSIRAPFAGRLGIRKVDLGEYISPGTAVVTLQALNPIYADFSLPQQELSRLSKGQTVKLTVDTYPGKSFSGTITAINPKVDQATRSVQVQATLRNDDGRLRPGMFAQAAVQLPTQHNVVTVPQTAVSYNPYGDSIYIVQKPEGKGPATVKRVFVKTGATRGDQVAVVQGVKAGQEVVTAGQMKLHDGSAITINNSITPSNKPSPTPPDE